MALILLFGKYDCSSSSAKASQLTSWLMVAEKPVVFCWDAAPMNIIRNKKTATITAPTITITLIIFSSFLGFPHKSMRLPVLPLFVLGTLQLLLLCPLL